MFWNRKKGKKDDPSSPTPKGLTSAPRDRRPQADSDDAQAAEHQLRAGNTINAMLLFEKAGLYGRAAEVAVHRRDLDRAAGYFEKAGELSKAATIYFDLKKYPKAEQLVTQMGKKDELGEIYERRGEKELAARAYVQSEHFEKAADLLESLGNLIEAAQAMFLAYEEAKQDILGFGMDAFKPKTKRLGERAAQLFRKTGQHRRAAKVAIELQQYPDAARDYVEVKDYENAAKVFELLGELDEAQKYWDKAGNPSRAAKMEGEKLASEGHSREAAAKFAELGDYARAAEAYLDLQEPGNAANMYEKAGEFSIAASFYRHAGDYEKAARCFEEAGDAKQAIECYERANLFDQELALRKQIGDNLGVARRLIDRGNTRDAMSFLNKISDSDTGFKTALALKGKVFLAMGQQDQAEECFQRSIQTLDRISGDDLDTLYYMSRLTQKPKAQEQALQILDEMLRQNLVDPRIVDKAQEIRRSITSSGRPKAEGTFMADAPGKSALELTRYVPLLEIGRGGMGIVYKAKDKTLDRTVALKILPASLKKNARAVNTFLREAKAAAALNHPNIVTIHDTGIQNGEYYIAMEYIDGFTLKEILKTQKKIPYHQALDVVRQIMEGLAYAHSKNIVHRDLTTNNVMWTRQKIVKIMDFGLAKVMKELLSEQSIIGGTPSFMSPEQTVGKPIDHRTDIYSLGICIYELVLGELPFQKGDLGYHHLHTPPPVPKEVDPTIPEVLSGLILKCMEKAPENRFQSIDELRAVFSKL